MSHVAVAQNMWPTWQLRLWKPTLNCFFLMWLKGDSQKWLGFPLGFPFRTSKIGHQLHKKTSHPRLTSRVPKRDLSHFFRDWTGFERPRSSREMNCWTHWMGSGARPPASTSSGLSTPCERAGRRGGDFCVWPLFCFGLGRLGWAWIVLVGLSYHRLKL